MTTTKEKIKKKIVKLMPKSLVRFIEQEYINNDIFLYRNISFSQEGEDLILHRLMQEKDRGFYVDIGAHHPLRFSNTHSFYLKGWRGINIDAMPRSMEAFYNIRPGDINLEMAISDEIKTIKYYMFSENAFNTFCEEIARNNIKRLNEKLITEKEVIGLRLENILDQYLPNNVAVDFMSVDVEGYELQVLKSNNWDKYKPHYLLIEVYANLIEELFEMNIHKYLSDLNYKLVARTPNTSLYRLVIL